MSYKHNTVDCVDFIFNKYFQWQNSIMKFQESSVLSLNLTIIIIMYKKLVIYIRMTL